MTPTWQTSDGSIRLYLGDCLDVLPTLAAGSVDCIVTSPPYNQMAAMPDVATGSWADSRGAAGFVRKWREDGYEDEMPEPEYQQWQNRVFAECSRLASPRGSLFYNHQVRWRDGVILHPVLWFRPEGWTLREEIIWDRGGGMMSNAKMFCRFDERILWFDQGRHVWNQEATGRGTIWRIARRQQQQGKLHPVEWPLSIPLRCLEATTEPSQTVADPFMGSGTAGVACVRTGRRFVGIEKEERFFHAAVQRLTDELGRQPLFEPAPSVQRSLLADGA